MIDLTKNRIRLVPGNRATQSQNPSDGLCFMELCAYLAGEAVISDKPQNVCPVIAKYLRTFNDALATDAGRFDYLMPTLSVVLNSATDDPNTLDHRHQAFLLSHMPLAKDRVSFALDTDPIGFSPEQLHGFIEYMVGGHEGTTLDVTARYTRACELVGVL